MQQMSPQDVKGEWQNTYSGYEGTSQEDEQVTGSSGQKLDIDSDEQFADMLARKIKEELKSEVQANTILQTRVALAIISVIALVPLFGILVWALGLNLMAGASEALGWGFVAACFVIMVVNGSFNDALKAIREKEQKREGKK